MHRVGRKDVKEVERVLKALANRRRLAIVMHLSQVGEASVGDIAKAIELSFKATSKHLGVLSAANLIDRKQISLNMYYECVRPLNPIVKTILSIL